jgi:hypothetical protein
LYCGFIVCFFLFALNSAEEHTMSLMNTFAITATTADTVNNPATTTTTDWLDISFADGECENPVVYSRGRRYVAQYVSGVDVRFSGRTHASFKNISGWVFFGDAGDSDMVLEHTPGTITFEQARRWMEQNDSSAYFFTTVSVVNA